MKRSRAFKYRTLKWLMAIKGWRKRKFYFKHGEYYVSPHIPNKRYMYNKGHEFYCAFTANVGFGVTYQSQYCAKFKDWELGILDFKKA